MKATEQYFSVYTIYYNVQVSKFWVCKYNATLCSGCNGYTDRRLAEVNK